MSSKKRALAKAAGADPSSKRVKIHADAKKTSGGARRPMLAKLYTHTDPDSGKKSVRLYKKDEAYMIAKKARLVRRRKRRAKKITKKAPGKKAVSNAMDTDEDANPKKILEFSDLTNRFEGQVCVVTGGGGGIGQVAALRLAKEGASVYLLDPRKWVTTLKWCAEHGTGKEANFYAYPCDVSDRKSVEKALKEIYDEEGMIDVLVNCAWTHKGDDLSPEDVKDSDIDKVFGTNFRGTFNMIRAVLPYMRENKYGRIVNVVSTDAVAASNDNDSDEKTSGMMDRVLQASASGAVVSMTKCMSQELGRQGILMNAVMCQRYSGSAAVQNPLKRHGLRGEIAAVISFAACEENSYSVGTVYDVSGGLASY